MRRLLPLWTRREVQVQYRQSLLDLSWSLITPVVTLVGYGFVLTQAFGVTGDGIPYLTFAWSGVVVWTFVANALSRGAMSLVASADLLRKASFPREIVPIATVVSCGLDLVIGLAVLAILMVAQGVGVTYHAVAAIPILLVAALWSAGCAIALATVTAFVRDLAHGLNVVLRIGIFITPVMYPVTEVPERYRWTTEVNPIAVFIEALRDSLLRGRWPDLGLVGVHLAATVAVFALALAYLRRVEGRIADVV